MTTAPSLATARKACADERQAAWNDAQHARGKLSARERIEFLLDEGSASEFGALAAPDEGGDGVITLRGTVGGRPVCVYAKDMSSGQGSLSESHARKICRLQEFALRNRIPIIGMFDTAGLRLEAGIDALTGFGTIARHSAAASGVVPQVSLIFGACPGADALLPPLGDFIFMVNGESSLFLSAPDVVRSVAGEDLSADQLGGPAVHAKLSSLADHVCDNDAQALLRARRLIELLPAHRGAGAPVWSSFDHIEREAPSLDTLVPLDPASVYDVRELILRSCDEADFFELQADCATNVVIGLCRMDGCTVGMVANQAASLAGVLDAKALRKAARFVRFCDAFGIALVTFVDAPGFLPGAAQEHGGIAREAAMLLSAYARASVPLVTVVVRRAFGAAGLAMASRAIGADMVYAWPQSQIGLLGAKGALALLGAPADAVSEAGHVAAFLSPAAAGRGHAVDDVIAPRQTRRHVIEALRALRGKARARPLCVLDDAMF
jgi:propionyl-CoA carboxylase beta chain